ncbi:unnamed protein product [Mytilus coruscus]|uniref:Uncharacterized protein n=1 Tax=Mytilus coruscus TaxID=42192 RepID=A0A6J8CRB9_MYTCO|nr:unnamed protein product [Mytilus coruscus]
MKQKKNICGGQYYHFGLESSIKNALSDQSDLPNFEKSIKILMNTDGIPLFRSSRGQFWPIVGRLENIGKGEPFIIGLYYVGLHIHLNSHLVALYSDYSNDLLKAFVKHFGEKYGNNQLVYNVHGLIHIAADAKKFGSLDNISSFPFESYLKKFKKMVRKPAFSSQQIIRRFSEKTYSLAETVASDLKEPHDLGSLPVGFNGCNQYQTVKFDKFVLKLRQRDRYFRFNGHIAQRTYSENIISKNGDIYVAYRIFTQTIKFFDTPLDSDLPC